MFLQQRGELEARVAELEKLIGEAKREHADVEAASEEAQISAKR